MKVIVVASDKYVNLLNGYSRLFNRHWSENKQVDILCYKKPDFDLPKNFNVISLGNQDDFDESWTKGIRKYFENLEDEYFMLCLEDHFMFDDMDFEFLDRAEKEIQKEEVKKIWCSFDKNKKGDPYSEDFKVWSGVDKILPLEGDEVLFSTDHELQLGDKNEVLNWTHAGTLSKDGIVRIKFRNGNNENTKTNIGKYVTFLRNDKIVDVLEHNCGIPTSLSPSIWKKSLFLKLIKDDLSIREFEEQSKDFALDGSVLFPNNSWLFPHIDCCRGGSFNDKTLDNDFVGPWGENLSDNDKEIFEQARRDLYEPSQIKTSQYYGQWETDSIIEKYFDSDYVGTCIEVGAADGTKGSNTKYFEESGWKTLCIEANPEYQEDLKCRNHVVMSACGKEENQSVDFNVFVIGKNKIKSSLSGLEVDEKLLESHSHLIHEIYKIKVPVRKLDSILDEVEFSRDIDFISIDTEGTELDVLEGIDLNTWNVKLLVVENNHNEDKIEKYLNEYGYIKDRRYKVNDFYIKSS